MTDAFQRMVADLGAPTPTADGARHALVMARAAAVLSATQDPELQALAGGMLRWLRDGGTLEAALGLRPGRGKSNQFPPTAHRRAALARDMVRLLDRAGVPPDRRASAAARVVRANPIVATVMHAEIGEPPPTSRSAWTRILRAAES